jgi:hypothetical protein
MSRCWWWVVAVVAVGVAVLEEARVASNIVLPLL